MSQVSLWQKEESAAQYAELCNALYERELNHLAAMEIVSATAVQGRLKSLPYYVKRTANLMIQTQSPLELDVQNASWSAKQSAKIPLTSQAPNDVWLWYEKAKVKPGMIVPIKLEHRIVIDSIDRVDNDKSRFRTNAYGWFDKNRVLENDTDIILLKPNKKGMIAACAGHSWCAKGRLRPVIPSMRELLLSCAINWRDFKFSLPF